MTCCGAEIPGDDSVWRPRRTVENWPLALCDSQTVDQRGLIAADRVRKQFVAETLWSVEDQRRNWYYWPDQSPSEIVLFKIADSSESMTARSEFVSALWS